jgi:hypothetical protein
MQSTRHWLRKLALPPYSRGFERKAADFDPLCLAKALARLFEYSGVAAGAPQSGREHRSC